MADDDRKATPDLSEKHGSCLVAIFGLVFFIVAIWRFLFLIFKKDSTLKKSKKK